MASVFKIRHGKETDVYRMEAAVDKKGLLAISRSVMEVPAAKRRTERVMYGSGSLPDDSHC